MPCTCPSVERHGLLKPQSGHTPQMHVPCLKHVIYKQGHCKGHAEDGPLRQA